MAKDQAKKIKITDPDTGDIIEGTEEELQQFYDTLKDLISKENWQKAADAIASIKLWPGVAVYEKINQLRPYIDAELQKPEYGGATLTDLLDQYELKDLESLPEDSLLYKAMQAAQLHYEIIKQQNDGRRLRKETKLKAEQAGAIMTLKDGVYPIPSQKSLWNAFAPGRLYKMGTLDREYIDEDTGEIMKTYMEDGELLPITAGEVNYQAYLLLNAIMANSVENIREEFIQDGQITFYVKGVLDEITDDPRSLLADYPATDRKTAGILYLEKLFEPLQGYIGVMENGSRYSVFNYIGYDAEADTMTIQTPYVYQLWRTTQGLYFERQQHKEEALIAGKRPKKNDTKPLEINRLFKKKAYTADPTTLEIAVYITNVLLSAGSGKGKPKATEFYYKTIIKNCPKLQARLADIEARSLKPEQTETGGKRNYTAIYNSELRKIKNAFILIFDRDKCDALQIFDFIEIDPSRQTDAGIEVVPPTKSMLQDKLTIIWRRTDKDPAS